MTSRADIIKAQESIGNVEINKEKFDNLPDDCCKGWISITNKEDYEGYDSDIYFAPRDVIYPEEKIGCGKEESCDILNRQLGDCEIFDGDKIVWRCPEYNPSCQKKKDNHSQQTKLRRENGNLKYRDSTLDTTEDKTADNIQSSKIFEDGKKEVEVFSTGFDIWDKENDIRVYFHETKDVLLDAVNYYQEKWGKI
jgi:hypothetical protein